MPRVAASLCCFVLAWSVAACDPAPNERGRSCSTSRECGGLRCRAELAPTPEDLAPLPLRCGDAMGDAAAGASCTLPTDCDDGICLLAGACASACAQASDCAASQRCQAVFARSHGDALQQLHACVNHVDLPASANARIVERTTQLTQDQNEVELDALPTEPAGAVAIDILEHAVAGWPQGGSCRSALCVRRLSTRDQPERVLYDAEVDYATQPPPPNPVASGDHIDPAVLLLPSATQAVLSPAGYRVGLRTERAGELQLTRITHVPGGQRLDLNLFYVGVPGLAPEADRGPALIADALAEVDRIFAQADIFIGDVRQIAVGGALSTRGATFANADPASGFATLQVRYGVYIELPALFRLSAGASNSAINLFFVRDIAPLSGDGEPQAEAGGVPGPLGLHGTGSSGIAIATEMMAGDARRMGRTLAHELAHYLGLFHTSEADGRVLDALDDTPECRAARDVGGDGLDAADCAAAGADNLMFWSVTEGTTLSPQQRAILRAAVILQ